MIPRRQLPVASPVSMAAVARAAWDTLVGDGASTPAAALLVARYDACAALPTDSGTSALVLALRLVVRKGGIVAYPAYACIDLAAAAIRAGVRVRLYDLDPSTLSPDLESVRSVLDRGVDAIVVAHLFGYPADVDAVRALAQPRGVPVIEDAAQAAGGFLRGRRLGAIGDLSVLSFGRGKGLCAGGGGAVLARTAHLRARLEGLVLPTSSRGLGRLALTTAQWMLGRPAVYQIPSMIPWLRLGEMVYHEASEPDSIARSSAALLSSAIALDDEHVEARRGVAALIDEQARAARGAGRVEAAEGAAPGYLRYAVRDLTGARSIAPAFGIVRPYPGTLAEQQVLAPLLMAGEPAVPGAMVLSRTLFTLPTHHLVTARDLAQLGTWWGNEA